MGSKYVCQGCKFNNNGWCKKHKIENLKVKKIQVCESHRKTN